MAEPGVGDEYQGYLLTDELGRGAQTVVFDALHSATGGHFAIKVLLDEPGGIPPSVARQAAVLRKLRHRNIVRLHGFMELDGYAALLVERVEGGDLQRWLDTDWGSPDVDERLALFQGVLRGIAHAHAQGFVHLDLKPSNVLLRRRRGRITPRVTDFGIVRMLDADRFHSHLSFSGAMRGTLGYMAPEQTLSPVSVDHRADIWSLGCLLYQMMCGTPPYPGGNQVEVLSRTRDGVYVPPLDHRPALPLRVALAISSCLDPHPDGRPGTVGALADLLDLQDAANPIRGEIPSLDCGDFVPVAGRLAPENPGD